jgi:hypothetical protein
MKPKYIHIDGYDIPVPQPTRKEDVLFVNEKPENAFWRRQEDIPKHFFEYSPITKINASRTAYNEDGVLEMLSEEDTKRTLFFLQREMYRRRYGVHMKNGEDIIWLHPDYYYNLQWGPMIGLPGKWGAYRHFQNDFLIKRGWARGQATMAGMFTVKPKKTGITQILAGAYLNDSTMTKNVEYHMMSKTGPDVEDVNMAFFFYMYDEMPYIMKPKEKKRNESELLFGNPVGRTSRSQKGQLQKFLELKTNVLNTRIKANPTKESGFDGPLVYCGWVDEYPKLYEASRVHPDKVFKKTIETVKKQQEIYGFLDYTSYVVEVDDKGFEEARQVFLDSEKDTVNSETGRTRSTMITHMISVLDAMEGQFNKQGKCDHKKTLHLINMELSSKTEASEKLRLRRQYPVNRNDAWSLGGMSSLFNNMYLGRNANQVDEVIRTGKRPWKEGRLRWVHEPWELGVKRPPGQFCPVFLEELSDEDLMLQREGRLKIMNPLDPRRLNEVIHADHRHEDTELLCPFLHNPYCGAFDPTDYLLKKEVRQGSKNAGHTFCIYDPSIDAFFNRTASNIFTTEYFFRPDDPDEAYEDLVKEIIWTGKLVLVEANKPWVCTKLIADGLQHFLMVRKSDGSIAPYAPEDEKMLVYTTDKVIEAYCREIGLYFQAPKTENTPDYAAYYRSAKGYEQLMKFDSTDTKKFDIAVDIGLTLLCRSAFEVWRNKMLSEDSGIYSAEGLGAAVDGLIDF